MLSQFVFVLKIKIKQAFDEAFGYLKRVIVTLAVYPRLFEFHHFDIQSTGQKSHCFTLTFRALSRNHIASTPFEAIAMLCF